MQTRFYDSDEPGPPNGWLDAGHGIKTQESRAGEKVITAILRAGRPFMDALPSDASVHFWGSLRLEGYWWIYRSVPAGVDRYGRPVRTLTVLFCSSGSKVGLDWTAINAVAPELDALAKNRDHLPALLRRLDNSPSSASLTDDLLKQPATPLLEALKSEMGRLLDGLGEGSHEYFTIAENGTVSNRGQENISPKPPPPPPTPKPTSETAPPSAPVKQPQPHKPPLMTTFNSHALVLVIGLLLGFGLHWVSSPKPPVEKPRKSLPEIRSDDDAIFHLRKATDYLEQSLERRSGPLTPGEPEPQPPRRSSTLQNPPN